MDQEQGFAAKAGDQVRLVQEVSFDVTPQFQIVLDLGRIGLVLKDSPVASMLAMTRGFNTWRDSHLWVQFSMCGIRWNFWISKHLLEHLPRLTSISEEPA